MQWEPFSSPARRISTTASSRRREGEPTCHGQALALAGEVALSGLLATPDCATRRPLSTFWSRPMRLPPSPSRSATLSVWKRVSIALQKEAQKLPLRTQPRAFLSQVQLGAGGLDALPEQSSASSSLLKLEVGGGSSLPLLLPLCSLVPGACLAMGGGCRFRRLPGS